MGPRGRNILLEKEYGPPLIVNDGVTIARNIELPNRAHNAGAKLVQEVASTSDEWAGDGTSSTTILTAEIAKKVGGKGDRGIVCVADYGTLQCSELIRDEQLLPESL